MGIGVKLEKGGKEVRKKQKKEFYTEGTETRRAQRREERGTMYGVPTRAGDDILQVRKKQKKEFYTEGTETRRAQRREDIEIQFLGVVG
jgi:hypothetical protein